MRGSPVGKEQFLRSGWRKRERHRELDGELLPFSLDEARLTVVKQSAVMASQLPQDPAAIFYGHRSLHGPPHVPFSPIRSGNVPSLLGLSSLLYIGTIGVMKFF